MTKVTGKAAEDLAHEITMEALSDIFNIILSCDNNYVKLKQFIQKYNLIQDKITDIYSYYDYYNDDIKFNILLLGNNYIYSFYYKESDNIINAYEVSINIDSNMIYIKCIYDGKNRLTFEKHNNDYIKSTFEVFSKTNFQYIFTKTAQNYIIHLDENITNHIKNTNINYFEHTQIGNIISFRTHNITLLYQNNAGYVYVRKDNITNIKYTTNTFHIDYTKDDNTKLITKQIYVNNQICFDSEIYISGYAHKINKLICNFDNFNFNSTKSAELPYFLFDKNSDINLLTVYAFTEPMVYNFTVNLLNLNSVPIQYKYIIDNFGELFSFQSITENTDIIEYYDSNDKIIIENFKIKLINNDKTLLRFKNIFDNTGVYYNILNNYLQIKNTILLANNFDKPDTKPFYLDLKNNQIGRAHV